MKAPEKIYIDQHPFRDEYEEYWYSAPSGDKSVEYIRKDIVNSMLEMVTRPTKSEVRRDVFIDKACEWMSSHLQMQYDGFSDFIKDFRKAMKGE